MMNTKIKCPVCGNETEWEGNPFRPFCSEKCSLIDLGKWADGKYSVEGEKVNPHTKIFGVGVKEGEGEEKE